MSELHTKKYVYTEFSPFLFYPPTLFFLLVTSLFFLLYSFCVSSP
jgi:hypothetical protein